MGGQDFEAGLRMALAGALVGWEDVDGQDMRETPLMLAGVLAKVMEYFTPHLKRAERLEVAELEAMIFQALGAASVAWTETPSGIFDSDRCKHLGDDLIAWLKGGPLPDWFLAPAPPGEGG